MTLEGVLFAAAFACDGIGLALVSAGSRGGLVMERATEHVRDWRACEEFSLNPSLALDALFVRLCRELAA